VELDVGPALRVGLAVGADFAAGAGLFVVSLLAFSLIGNAIAKRVAQSEHGAIDRSLGFLFGLFRGVLLVAVAYMVVSWIVMERDQPAWATEARVYPMIREVAREIELLLPAGMRQYGRDEADDADRRIRDIRRAQELYDSMRAPAPMTRPAEPERQPGYSPTDREGLTDQIRRIQ
jgi:membrane protein required for colicin V production